MRTILLFAGAMCQSLCLLAQLTTTNINTSISEGVVTGVESAISDRCHERDAAIRKGFHNFGFEAVVDEKTGKVEVKITPAEIKLEDGTKVENVEYRWAIKPYFMEQALFLRDLKGGREAVDVEDLETEIEAIELTVEQATRSLSGMETLKERFQKLLAMGNENAEARSKVREEWIAKQRALGAQWQNLMDYHLGYYINSHRPTKEQVVRSPTVIRRIFQLSDGDYFYRNDSDTKNGKGTKVLSRRAIAGFEVRLVGYKDLGVCKEVAVDETFIGIPIVFQNSDAAAPHDGLDGISTKRKCHAKTIGYERALEGRGRYVQGYPDPSVHKASIERGTSSLKREHFFLSPTRLENIIFHIRLNYIMFERATDALRDCQQRDLEEYQSKLDEALKVLNDRAKQLSPSEEKELREMIEETKAEVRKIEEFLKNLKSTGVGDYAEVAKWFETQIKDGMNKRETLLELVMIKSVHRGIFDRVNSSPDRTPHGLINVSFSAKSSSDQANNRPIPGQGPNLSGQRTTTPPARGASAGREGAANREVAPGSRGSNGRLGIRGPSGASTRSGQAVAPRGTSARKQIASPFSLDASSNLLGGSNVTIYNLMGQPVFQGAALDVTNLPSGTYIKYATGEQQGSLLMVP